MKYEIKIGDKVKIKEGLVIGERYQGIHYLAEMNDRLTRTLEVVDTYTCIGTEGMLYLASDGYWYSEAMLEPVCHTTLNLTRKVVKAWFKSQPWYNELEEKFNQRSDSDETYSLEKHIETYPDVVGILSAAFVLRPFKTWNKRNQEYVSFLANLKQELGKVE